MHTTTETSTPPATLTTKHRRISGGVIHGMTWTVFSDSSAMFLFAVTYKDRPLHTSTAEFPTAPKAERAARTWCEAQAEEARPVEVVPDAERAGAVENVVNGWEFFVVPDKGGTFRVEVFHAASGEAFDDGDELRGFESRAIAVDAATAWATANRVLCVPDASETAQEVPPGDPAAPLAGPPAASEEAPVEAPPADPRDIELEQLRAEREQMQVERDLALRQRDAAIAGLAADLSEVTAQADEYLELNSRRRVLEDRIEDAKLELKSIEKKLAGRSVDTMQLLQGLAHGERGKVYQQRLAFAESAETRAVIAAAAAKAAPPWATEAWAFNGVEHTIESHKEVSPDGDRWTTWLKGHRRQTEGFGESYEQAVEATKVQASMVFADADPGSTAASNDAGPVADGPRKPAKKPAAKLKGHDQAEVVKQVRAHLTLPEAAIVLGCSPQQLEKYLDKQGIGLASIQGRDAGIELPVAPEEKAGKARGRKAKRGAT